MRTRINIIYHGMLARCYSKKHPYYHRYGGRGITVCNDWLNSYKTFKNWALTHGYQDNLSIDRIDNNKGYSPDNCHWVTHEEQCNNRENSFFVTYKGETKTLAQWCKKLHLNYRTVTNRIYVCHWTPEKALETKVRTFPKIKHGLVTYKNKTQTVLMWCKELNISYDVVRTRLKRGWSIERTFEQQVEKHKKIIFREH